MPNTQSKKLTTISHHIDAEQNLHPEATGEFTSILNDLTLALRIISRDVRRAGLNDVLGLTSDTNIHGEQVKKLDAYSNEVIKKAMQNSGQVAIMASEEDDEIILTPGNGGKAKYVLVFDPLDGSSNIEVNVTIGTIFGLYKRLDPNSNEPGTVEDVLQSGYQLAAAGYALYGSSTMLVYTTGHGVHAFTYDPTLGEFLLTNENIVIPKKGKYYSANEGYYFKWSENLRQYINYLKTPADDKSRPYSLRYIGTAVADVHRTLKTGGIFLYPKDSSMPNGKLRIVYEANALALIIEQAGGRATDGERRILDIKPTTIHQRVPFIAG
ncbi:MAG: class 1 fructose-bisphosphatase, partial [Candidatus Kapaibacterium sp.]